MLSFVRARVNMSLIASLLVCGANLPIFAAPVAKPAAKVVIDPKLAAASPADLIEKLSVTRGDEQQVVIHELVRRGPEADRPLLEFMNRRQALIQSIFGMKGESTIPRLIALLSDAQLGNSAGRALTQAAASP